MNTPEQARAVLLQEMTQIFNTAAKVEQMNTQKLESGVDTTSRGAEILKTIKAAKDASSFAGNIVDKIRTADALHTTKQVVQPPRAVAS